jgi:hypothetical protein
MLEDATLDYQDKSKYATNGFLLSLIEFARYTGCLRALSLVEVPMKEVIHSVSEKIITLLLSYTIGCRSSNDINTQLKPDHLVAQSLGIAYFADDSAFSRFYERIDRLAVEDIASVRQMLYEGHGLARHLKGIILVDLDSTGLIVKGNQFELADAGYFAHHPGEIGYQLNLACASNVGKEVLAHLLDPGHVNPGARFWDLLYQVGEALGFLDERLFIRADRLYGVGAYVRHLIDLKIGFLIKGRDSRTARRWVEELGSSLIWLQVEPGCWLVDIGQRYMPNCPHPVRVILIRTLSPKDQTYQYSYFITSLLPSEASELDLFHFYNQRVTLEKLIERCKNVWHISHMPTHHFAGLLFYFELRFLAYNLVLWYQHHLLAQDQRLQAMTVFELVTTLAPVAVVAQQQPQAPVVLYLANAPRLIQSLLTLTQTWLRQVTKTGVVLLGHYCHLQYDWSRFIDDIWRATPRPDCWLLARSCKT